MPVVGVLDGFAVAEHLHTLTREVARDFFTHDDDRATAVGHDATVETVNGIRDQWRLDHVVDGDGSAQERVRVVLRVQ